MSPGSGVTSTTAASPYNPDVVQLKAPPPRSRSAHFADPPVTEAISPNDDSSTATPSPMGDKVAFFKEHFRSVLPQEEDMMLTTRLDKDNKVLSNKLSPVRPPPPPGSSSSSSSKTTPPVVTKIPGPRRRSPVPLTNPRVMPRGPDDIPDTTSCSFNSSRQFFESLSTSYEPKKVKATAIPSPARNGTTMVKSPAKLSLRLSPGRQEANSQPIAAVKVTASPVRVRLPPPPPPVAEPPPSEAKTPPLEEKKISPPKPQPVKTDVVDKKKPPISAKPKFSVKPMKEVYQMQ